MRTIAERLDAAADLLERDGWTQFRMLNAHTGARCAMGAINGAIFIGNSCRAGQLIEANDVARELAGYLYGFHHVDSLHNAMDVVICYNDNRFRTKDEVIGAFRAAAAQARRSTPTVATVWADLHIAQPAPTKVEELELVGA